jgi:hypothetical protein
VSASSPAVTPAAANRRHASRGDDPVGGEQRIQRPAGPHLALAQSAVHIGAPDGSACLDLSAQVDERRLHAGDDPKAEVALDRPRVGGHAGDHRLDHLLGGLVKRRAQHRDDRRIQLVPGMIVQFHSIGMNFRAHVVETIGENCTDAT